jgi:hypothetical protein
MSVEEWEAGSIRVARVVVEIDAYLAGSYPTTTTTLIRTQNPLVIGLPDTSLSLYLSTSSHLGPDDDRLDPLLGRRELFSVGGLVGTAKLSNAGVITNLWETKHFPNTLLDHSSKWKLRNLRRSPLPQYSITTCFTDLCSTTSMYDTTFG